MHIRAITLMVALTLSACAARYTAPIIKGNAVTFRLHAPDAKTVSIVGSFNRWQADHDPLVGPDAEGWWTIKRVLPAGRHEYLFVINGSEWVEDPHASATVDDGLGDRNCLIIMGQ